MEDALVTRRFLMSCVFAVALASLDHKEGKEKDAKREWAYEGHRKEPDLVYKWNVLTTDFSVAGGELTPLGTLKRDYICKKYKNEI